MTDNVVLSRCKLSIDPQALVLIYCHDTCRFALSSNLAQVTEHLRNKHKITLTERRRVTDLLRARIPKLQNPCNAPVREDASISAPNLHLVHGYTCKFCSERTSSPQVISRHITSNHEDERLRLGVRKKAMYEPVFLQAWTKNPPGGRYWIVEHCGSTIRPVGGQQAHDHLQDIFERERGRQRLLKEINLADGTGIDRGLQSTGFTDLKPWLERTGWEQTFRGVDRELLRSLTVVPSLTTSRQGLVLRANVSLSGHSWSEEQTISSANDESKIAALLAAVDAVMDRCEQTARTTSKNLLCWLRSVRPHSCYIKPFTFVAKVGSRKKYIRLLKRFIALIFRAFNLPANIRQRRAGIRFKKTQIRLISTLWNHDIWDQPNALMERFWQSIKPPDGVDIEIDSDEESADEEGQLGGKTLSDHESIIMLESDSTEADDTVEEEEEEEEEEYESPDHDESEYQDGDDNAMGESKHKTLAIAGEALELLFGLIIEFSTEEIRDGRPASALLVYFSGILGFSADLAGFLPARSYTTNLAALIYTQRLLLLEYALPARGYPRLGIPRRPRIGQVSQLQEVRQKYLVLGTESPFQELFSLLAFGRAIAGSETPAFLLKWSDDGQTVSYGDEISVHMEQFRRLPKSLLERAESLCEELMYGWKPPCDLFSIKDDMANTIQEYSFVSHPKNGPVLLII